MPRCLDENLLSGKNSGRLLFPVLLRRTSLCFVPLRGQSKRVKGAIFDGLRQCKISYDDFSWFCEIL